MKSPSEMGIIQIEITNACTHNCSNCTRFCGHYKKPFFMDFETFKTAVDSMEGFREMVGIMGGEPTLHPQFEKFVEYYSSKIKLKYNKFNILRNPVEDFAKYRNRYLCSPHYKRGLWSSLGGEYYKHFELIQDTFPFQCINDHLNPGLHQALLITRRELNIPDAEWYKLRDQCWVQNLWSASISPKGAFFCEIAAALDMLFDGPGGWPIEKGWWKRKPEDFGSQLGWCELCSAPLCVPRNKANDECDTISPLLLQKLIDAGSPKVNKKKYILFDISHYDSRNYRGNVNEREWYIPEGNVNMRVSSTNKTIFPHDIYIQDNRNDNINLDSFEDWCLIYNNSSVSVDSLVSGIKKTIFNPGCLYFYDSKMKKRKKHKFTGNADFILFNKHARALKDKRNITIGNLSTWDLSKQVHLYKFPSFKLPEAKLIWKIRWRISKYAHMFSR